VLRLGSAGTGTQPRRDFGLSVLSSKFSGAVTRSLFGSSEILMYGCLVVNSLDLALDRAAFSMNIEFHFGIAEGFLLSFESQFRKH